MDYTRYYIHLAETALRAHMLKDMSLVIPDSIQWKIIADNEYQLASITMISDEGLSVTCKFNVAFEPTGDRVYVNANLTDSYSGAYYGINPVVYGIADGEPAHMVINNPATQGAHVLICLKVKIVGTDEFIITNIHGLYNILTRIRDHGYCVEDSYEHIPTLMD